MELSETDQGIIRTIEVTIEEEILEEICDPSNQNYKGQNFRGGYRKTYGNAIIMTRGRSRSSDRQYSDNTRMNERSSSSSRSGSRTSTSRDRNRCYRCREKNHFTKGLSKFESRKRIRADTTDISI